MSDSLFARPLTYEQRQKIYRAIQARLPRVTKADFALHSSMCIVSGRPCELHAIALGYIYERLGQTRGFHGGLTPLAEHMKASDIESLCAWLGAPKQPMREHAPRRLPTTHFERSGWTDPELIRDLLLQPEPLKLPQTVGIDIMEAQADGIHD